MGSRNLNITRFEVSGVYTHPDARVDIVLVHGLNGQPTKTWTAKNGLYWPTDLLPASLKDHHANILVYGYNADVFSRGHESGASGNFIFQHAQTLVTHLTSYRKREGTTKNPIIWVAHSLGGILVKRALLYSNDVRVANHEPYRAIYVSTYGIIFLGTPHTGAGIATWGHVLQSMSEAIVPKKFFESESILLKTLKRDNERLQEINVHFLDIYQRFQIHMVHENRLTDFKGTKALVVSAESASPQLPGVVYYGVEANHSDMCKFDSESAPGYRIISGALYDWVEDAPPVIETRWEMEDEERMARARYEIDERNRSFMPFPLLGDGRTAEIEIRDISSLTSSPTKSRNPAPAAIMDINHSTTTKFQPPFLHPDQFRPNSYFVGREKELEELHEKLLDEKKRAEGTSAVLLHSLPGGGKTHLARQYVFKHLDDYSGGIYWVRSKSITEMEQFYCKIAKSDVLRDFLQKALSSIMTSDGKSISQAFLKPQDVIDIVRSWFNSFGQWLIVFDGIRFDTPGIHKFIPDAKNTSIIFTSIQQSATGMYEFDNPQLVNLGLLSPSDAQNLLLDEMEKKKPWTQDDKSRALELVQLMGRLPLMIHVAARHMKATQEPLSKYLRAYRARPRAGQLPAYRAVYSELANRGATAALNLMSILAFYDQWVPVGMVTLGLGALDNVTPVLTKDARNRAKSLDNTLQILIAFALVERTETDNVSPTSSQSSARRMLDEGSDSIDVLRIHSIVQAFFVDLLASKKELHFWLERAAKVYCTSFDEADKRILAEPKLGLPDDFRRFLLHGRKILEHLTRVEKKATAPTLGRLRTDVEARISLCQVATDRFSEATQKDMTGSVLAGGVSQGETLLTSVFERTNSLSESDSASQSSQLSLVMTSGRRTSMGSGEEASGKGKGLAMDRWMPNAYDGSDMQLNSSPVRYESDQMADENPYHWHIPYLPYPVQDGTIPAPPSQDDGDDLQTVVGTPRMVAIGSPGSDWGTPVMGHRTIRRNESRRYHDRAGSWRDSAVSDPRTTVSRKIAKGSVFLPEGMSEVESSEARIALNKIQSAASPPLVIPAIKEPMVLDTEAPQRSQSTSNLASSKKTEGSGFAHSLFKIFSVSQSLKRLRENILPQANASASAPALGENSKLSPPSPETPEPLASSIGSLINRQQSPMFRGTRSAQSSPSPGNGPFPPPAALSHSQGDIHKSNTRRPDFPAPMRPWATQMYGSGRTHLDSSDLGFDIADDNPMAASFPQPSHSHQVFLRPEPVITGYTSQPMSRNTSAQSQPEGESSRGTRISSRRTTQSLEHGYSHSLPISNRTGRPVVAIMMPSERQLSPASWVETEPSPRRDDAFSEVNTSYRRWEERHEQQRAGTATTISRASTGRAVSTAEPMARSGSSPGLGGIQLSDGRIVPFGQMPRREVDEGDSVANVLTGLGITREDTESDEALRS